MHWKFKGLLQALLARLPGGMALNDLLQQWAGGRRDARQHISDKFEGDWLVLMGMLGELGFAVRGRDLLEIGTGWAPALPLCFALAGARRVHCFDLHRHLVDKQVRATLAHLEPHLAALAAAAGEPEAVVRQRYARLMAAGNTAQLLQCAGIVYHAPADATATGLPDASVALVFSNSVLEHVHSAVLGPLMREAARLLAPDGLVVHSVNCGDHYAYFDRRITPINYLRFSARQWRLWNNTLLFQNRLRPPDFTRAATHAGLTIASQMQTVRTELMPLLTQWPVAAEFSAYTAQDLCTTSVTFAARRPPSLAHLSPDLSPHATPHHAPDQPALP